MKVRINSENLNKKVKIDLKKIDKIAEAVLKRLRKDNVEINIIFIGNQKIRALNRKYFGKDNSTDVISFPFKGTGSWVKGQGLRFLGDIAISSDKATQNSKEYGTTVREEVALYVIHGILHLIGYEDKPEKKRELMRKKENGLLQEIRKII